jgi:uncharacterized protein YabN with tetrapyrrole methylase and pyrophosphatase domain
VGYRTFAELVRLVAKLRGEEGCPWDRLQDHHSLCPYLLEETYETIAAIDASDSDALADELGDLLLQILLHSQIASEEGKFSIDVVIDRLAQKLVRRHPHVFGDAPKEPDTIRRTWEIVKARERTRQYPLPPLLQARKFAAKLSDKTVIMRARYPSAEAREGGKILEAIKTTWEKGIDPELALQKAIAYLSSFGGGGD